MPQRSARGSAQLMHRRVWIPDTAEGFLAGWIKTAAPGGGKEHDAEAVVEVVVSATNETRTVPYFSLAYMNPPQFDGVDDIADLTHLNEASVVNNLRQRYGSGSIYVSGGTVVGSCSSSIPC